MKDKELVYFIYPSCDGNCKHCWSSDIVLGRIKPIEWHYRLIEQLKDMEYSVIKLSGGEPFFNRDIGKIAARIHEVLGKEIPIQIFTSGRLFVNIDEGEQGVYKTKAALDSLFADYDNISIEMSVDEYHLQVLKRIYKSEIDDDLLPFMYISNFMKACFMIKKEHPRFLGPKLKIHCEEGRMKYHKELFAWFPPEWWEKYVLITEGLAYSGNGKNLEKTFKVVPSDKMSYFLLPGVDFYDEPQSDRGQRFQKKGKTVYLDSADSAVIISGWWNIINREAEYTVINC